MKISEFKLEVAPSSAEQDEYVILVEDGDVIYNVDVVRWEHSEKRVVIEIGEPID
jgi:hypothetical protein